ncbi:MAG: ATP-binding protein, partial [Nitrosomonas sp.]|nr:ATP-binding protein [Nitrosomonas sp.]
MPLEMMLKELRLTAFNQHLSDYQQQEIQNTWSYKDFLSKLCEQELARRFQIRTTQWIREAKIHAGKSFATLNLIDAPKNTQQAILQLKDNHQWALQADNVLL